MSVKRGEINLATVAITVILILVAVLIIILLTGAGNDLLCEAWDAFC